MILVVGGTGRLGALVTRMLADSGRAVRVLSRGVHRGEPLPPEVEQVRGDVRDPAAVAAALDGVETVVVAVAGSGPGADPASVDRDGVCGLVDAAERAGSEVVLVSALGAAEDSPVEQHRMRWAAEQRLRAAGVPWTVVRCERFTETWVEVLRRSAGRSGRPVVHGRAARPTRWVSVADVAELVVHAVEHPAVRGRVLEVCGPDALTLRELAAEVMAADGVPGRPRRVPDPVLRVLGATLGLVLPDLGRQVRATVAADRLPVCDDGPLRAEFTGLPRTPVSAVLAGPS